MRLDREMVDELSKSFSKSIYLTLSTKGEEANILEVLCALTYSTETFKKSLTSLGILPDSTIKIINKEMVAAAEEDFPSNPIRELNDIIIKLKGE